MLPLVIIPRFELKLFLELVKRYKITIASIVPPVGNKCTTNFILLHITNHTCIAVQLAKDPLVLKYDLSVIRHVNSGAAPLGKEHVDALMKRMPRAILTNLQVSFYPIS